MTEYDKQAALEIAEAAKRQGFRAFLAERGTYGFFTDAAGTRVISFQIDHGSPKFSGRYVTSAPRATGTGWQLDDGRSYLEMFNAIPPQWAVGGASWRYTTLAEHRATYQASSRYQEV